MKKIYITIAFLFCLTTAFGQVNKLPRFNPSNSGAIDSTLIQLYDSTQTYNASSHIYKWTFGSLLAYLKTRIGGGSQPVLWDTASNILLNYPSIPELKFYYDDPWFDINGSTRRFQMGDYTYDWYGTWMDINDNAAIRQIVLHAANGVVFNNLAGGGVKITYTDNNGTQHDTAFTTFIQPSDTTSLVPTKWYVNNQGFLKSYIDSSVFAQNFLSITRGSHYRTVILDTTNIHSLKYLKGQFYPLSGNPSSFLTANQSITLTGNVTGSGTTAITTTIGSGVVTNAMLAGSIDLTSKVTGTLPYSNGGTGQSSWTKGDILYASNTNTLSKLGIGSTGQVLTVASGLPSWASGGGGGITYGGAVTSGHNNQVLYISGSGALTSDANLTRAANTDYVITNTDGSGDVNTVTGSGGVDLNLSGNDISGNAGSVDVENVDASITAYNATDGLQSEVVAGSAGGTTSVEIQSEDGSNQYSWNWPTHDGAPGQVLATPGNASGAGWDGNVLYWVTPGGSSWGLTGNAGTNPSTNFLGTTDSVGLNIKVANTTCSYRDTFGRELIPQIVYGTVNFGNTTGLTIINNASIAGGAGLNLVGQTNGVETQTLFLSNASAQSDGQYTFGSSNNFNIQAFSGHSSINCGDSTIDIEAPKNLKIITPGGTAAGNVLTSDASGNWTSQPPGQLPHVIFTPTTGTTVNVSDNTFNIINPSGALLALTINFPSSPSDNDVIEIKFDQAVSTTTYTGGTIMGSIISPGMGNFMKFTFDAGTSTWY